MTEVSEDRVYARHDRRRGAVLIVGAGAVGGFLAEELSRVGYSLVLVDKDVLEQENLARHPLGAEWLGLPKASSLVAKIRRDFPVCDARGVDADFLALPESRQLALVRGADVVVAATDMFECQRRVNRVCLTAEIDAVFPAIWVDARIRDAEVSEILWVLPGRHTPCFECAVAFRQSQPDAQAGRGTRLDMQQLAIATAQIIIGLIDPTDVRGALLDPERTAVYIHGFTPRSRGVRDAFPTEGLRNQYADIPFPPSPCPACGGQQPRPAPAQPLPQPPRPVPARPVPRPHPPPDHSSAISWGAIAALLVVGLIVFGVYKASHHSAASAGSEAPAAQPTAVSSAPATNEQSTASSGINGWSSGQQVDSNNGLTSISCSDTSDCVGVDGSGYVYTYSGSSWSSGQQIDSSGNGITAISCPTTSFCGAIDSGADAYINSDGSWSSSSLVGADGGAANLTAISCPTDGYCVATGDYNVYTYSNGSWSSGVALQLPANFTAISCPTTNYCVATDDGGNVYVYDNGSWSSVQQVDAGNGFLAISCSSTSFCGAIDSSGNAYVDVSGSWSSSSLVSSDNDSANLTAISCPTDGYCLATGYYNVYVYSGGMWATGYEVQNNADFTSISCASTNYCVAADEGGNVYSYSGN